MDKLTEFTTFLVMPRLLGIADNLRRFVDGQPFTPDYPQLTDPLEQRAWLMVDCLAGLLHGSQFGEKHPQLAGVDLPQVGLYFTLAGKALEENDDRSLRYVVELLLIAFEPARAVMANPPDWVRVAQETGKDGGNDDQ